MDKSRHGRIHVTMEAMELGSQVKENPQDPSSCVKGNLSDSDRTLTNSFGEIQKIDLEGEPEVDSAVLFSQGKRERPSEGYVRTLASSIGNIERSDLGEESKAYVFAEVVAFGKQEICSDGNDIDPVVTTVDKITAGNEEIPITEPLKGSLANIQIGKKVKKRDREDKACGKSQVCILYLYFYVVIYEKICIFHLFSLDMIS
jgi:hypothetical protein